MSSLIKILFVGLLVSFLGSLPLGTLNIAVMQISISEGIYPALIFGFGTLTAEIIYVRLSLVAMDWVRKQEKIFRVLEWITLFIILALAFFSFYAAMNPSVEKNVILSSSLHKYWLGLIMSALNPIQIPFWFGWSTILFTKKILLPRNDHYNVYILGIGIGTLIGNLVFIYGGKVIGVQLKNNQHILSWIIGGIFALTAIIQMIRMMKKKDSVYQLKHPEEITQSYENNIH